MICPSCATQITDDSSFCNHCGAAIPHSNSERQRAGLALVQAIEKRRESIQSSPRPIAPSSLTQSKDDVTFAPTESIPSVCPICSSKRIERVSGLVARGTTHRKSTRTGVGGARLSGHGGIGVGTSSSSSTFQGGLVESLEAPQPGCIAMTVFILILGGVILTVFGLAPVGISSVIVGILLGLLTHPFAAYTTEKEHWESLFYCYKCDSVFNPGTGQTAHAAEMRSIL